MYAKLKNGVIIRSFISEHAESISKYANNKKIADNLRDIFPFPYTLQDATDWIELATSSEPSAHFAIEFKNECIGGIGLTLMEDIFSHSAEIGYWLGEPFWGKGIISECINPVLNYAFSNLGLERVFALTYTSNAGSMRVLEKNNFTLEGTFKKGAYKDGIFYDVIQYAILKEDFHQ